jgi:hypothetical protein
MKAKKLEPIVKERMWAAVYEDGLMVLNPDVILFPRKKDCVGYVWPERGERVARVEVTIREV